MVTIFGAPPIGPPTAPGGITTTRVIFHYHETSGVAGQENVQVSDKLPVPCVILYWECYQDTSAPGIRNWTQTLYLSNNNSVSTLAADLGTRITSHKDFGSSPPDIDLPRAGDLTYPTTNTYIRLPLWIPVYESPTYIKTLGWQVAIANMAFYNIFVIGLLETAGEVPGAGIIPRGTPQEPVCVNICGVEPGAFPPTPAGPAPAPFPPAAPLPPAAIDPIQDPLPPACPVDPTGPLARSTSLCEVP